MQLSRERQVAEEAARAAGGIIRELYDGSYEVGEKGRDNPITEADTRADRCIREMVCGAFPEDGWLSEETTDTRRRLGRERVWIVDPLDGTKEFIQHVPELCVCIALTIGGEAVLGVQYNPIRDELFSSARGQGMQLNGRPVRASERTELQEARVLASRSEIRRGEWEPFEPYVQVVPTGSVAYKLACVAAGMAEATFSLTPKNEWDVCAGAALLSEAGGVIVDRDAQPLRFNREDTKLPGLIACNAALYPALRELIARVGMEQKTEDRRQKTE